MREKAVVVHSPTPAHGSTELAGIQDGRFTDQDCSGPRNMSYPEPHGGLLREARKLLEVFSALPHKVNRSGIHSVDTGV